ncbi:YuiB family protein [Bacillus sp. AK128]
MNMSVPVLLISLLLFFVLFFGIGFLLNMLLRATWVMAIIYPIIFVFIVDNIRFIDYFTNTQASFSQLGQRVTSLAVADITILLFGLLGAICSGLVIKTLRSKGYQMF